jgi:predicted nuclease of restriction endonuclease-like (RecB) superfamily
LSWTHFIALIPLKDPLQRDYYAQMASAERWSVRTLRERIDSMLYERTALSQKPGETIAQELATMRDAQRMSPALVMRDPYILDFLGLRDTWQEGDLEAAIIREMESFLLELGAGFSFVARQKRIQIDDEDFHLDLLFYNRKLRRLVAVELKVGEFKAAYKGQMELYLRWLTSTNGSRRKPRRWDHPLHRQEARADRIAGAGQVGHPRRRVPDRLAAEGRAGGAAATGNAAGAVADRAAQDRQRVALSQAVGRPGVPPSGSRAAPALRAESRPSGFDP